MSSKVNFLINGARYAPMYKQTENDKIYHYIPRLHKEKAIHSLGFFTYKEVGQ